jgi:hypothetical protein
MFKNKNKKIKKIAFIVFLSIFILLVFLYLLGSFKKDNLEPNKDFFGITYSKKYAEELGLDWEKAYLAILDDLQVKHIRLPLYWDDFEKEEGVFNFKDYIFMIEEGEKRGVEFVLSFGMRVPRWPECHIPNWVDVDNNELLQEKTLEMISVVVEEFKEYESISYWQVENEPLLNTFGVCPEADYDFLKKEVALTRKLDDRPIILSATGELSFWKREVELADYFGTTMYRVVDNPYLGYFKYPYPALFYTFKANLLKADLDKVFVIELQAEPWTSMENLKNGDSKEHLKSFSLEDFKSNVDFAHRTGFKRTYLWGAEWWFFRHHVLDDSSYWNFAKSLFN